jgi:hypothetical protein
MSAAQRPTYHQYVTRRRLDDLDVVEVIDLENGAMPAQVDIDQADVTTRTAPRWRLLCVVAAVTAAAALLGFTVGRSGRPEPAASAPSASLSILSIAPNGVIGATGRRCAVWTGRELQVGVEVENLGPAGVQLAQLDVAVPSRDLRQISVGASACGQLGAAEPLAGLSLSKLGTAWVSVVLLATVSCPAASAAEFRLTYTQSAQSGAIDNRAVADLGQVPYEGCPHTQSASSI